MISVFDYLEIREYLLDLVAERGERGFKARIADASGCQRSFLSQVLRGTAQLTAEHAIGIAEAMGFSDLETLYFEVLVAQARAGTIKLRRHYKRRLGELRHAHADIGRRFNQPRITDEAVAAAYYSSWEYAVIHMLVTVPAWQTAAKLAERLALPRDRIEALLGDLRLWGLVAPNATGVGFHATTSAIHINRDHPLMQVHHRNLRIKATDRSRRNDEHAIQFSAVYSLAERDVWRLAQEVQKLVDKSKEIVAPSKEEDVVVLTLDYFRP